MPGRPDQRAAGVRASRLFELHGKTVLRVCRKILHDRGEAEDAAQQTFLLAYRHLRVGFQPDDPEAWLARIARNECIARIRRRRRLTLTVVPLEQTPTSYDPVEDAIRRTDVAALLEAIAALPRLQRRAFVLRELSGLSYDEVAEVMETSRPSLDSLLYRARQRLRGRLRAISTLALAPLSGLRELLVGAAGAGAGKVAVGAITLGVVGAGVGTVEWRDSGSSRPPAPRPVARAAVARPVVSARSGRAAEPAGVTRRLVVNVPHVAAPVQRRPSAPARQQAPVSARRQAEAPALTGAPAPTAPPTDPSTDTGAASDPQPAPPSEDPQSPPPDGSQDPGPAQAPEGSDGGGSSSGPGDQAPSGTDGSDGSGSAGSGPGELSSGDQSTGSGEQGSGSGDGGSSGSDGGSSDGGSSGSGSDGGSGGGGH